MSSIFLRLYSVDDCLMTYEKVQADAISLSYTGNVTREDVSSLLQYCYGLEYIQNDSKERNRYSEPMVWIGIYIAVASLFCILAMAADLLRGFRNRKLWFPCKYFTLNAASITVITVAMKLPVDLNNPVPGVVDVLAKFGSLAFMCTIMANLMPSLASMDNKELFANVIGLTILVITMVVNILIQLKTHLLEIYFLFPIPVMLIFSLLIILTSSAITTPTLKRILELKYQAAHKIASNGEHPRHTRLPTVEELIQHVRRYWVMAGTCSPQFVMASTPLCSAVGVICVCSAVIHFFLVAITIPYRLSEYQSDYKWSMLVILITQSVGIAVGTIAPIFRCFAALSFKLSTKWSRNHMKVLKVEKYWTQKLLEWKESHIAFLSSGRRSKTLIHNLKNFILSLCIGFQKVIVVSCKMIGLIPIAVVIFTVYCLYCWKSLKVMLFTTPVASSSDTVHEVEENNTNEDLTNYVLQLQDEMELAQRTLSGISKSINRLIQNAEKQQHSNLLRLLQKSTGFKGVENFDSDQVQHLLSVELLNCWSLPVVTLTCIAIALSNIRKDIVDNLYSSIGEGLLYTRLVEGCHNSLGESANIQKATKALWHEVEYNCKWLGNTLQRNAYKEKTSTEILKWLVGKAEKIVVEINESTHGEPIENSPYKLIVANSMYRIAQTILLNYQSIIEQISEEQLLDLLSRMIADILAACFTNLPRVIAMKCHESAIEKREASVEAAAKLLGGTKEIINKLQVRELPSMDPDQMASIDEWRAYLKQEIP